MNTKQKIEKSIARIKMILHEFCYKWRDYSFIYALNSAIWWIAWYAHFHGIRMWAGRKKESYIFKYMNKNFSEIIQRYKTLPPSSKKIEEYPVWVFWAQGFEHAPELVKMCYANLKRIYSDVRVVTMANFRDYVNIPESIIVNLEKGNITYTNFSDVLRCSLLGSYGGGLWADSTCWITDRISDELSKCAFYSVKDSREGSRTNWCAWVLGTNIKNAKIFSFAEEIFFEHFKTHKTIIDTYFIDFIFQFAKNEFADVAKDMDELPYNSENRNDMHFMLNKPYDKDRYDELTFNRWIFKLSYKTEWRKFTDDGKLTFYGYFLESIDSDN